MTDEIFITVSEWDANHPFLWIRSSRSFPSLTFHLLPLFLPRSHALSFEPGSHNSIPNAKSTKERIQWLGPSRPSKAALGSLFKSPSLQGNWLGGTSSHPPISHRCSQIMSWKWICPRCNQYQKTDLNPSSLPHLQMSCPFPLIYLCINLFHSGPGTWNVYTDWESLGLSDHVLCCISNDALSSGSSWLLCLSNAMDVRFSLVG